MEAVELVMDDTLSWYLSQERVSIINPRPRRHVRALTYEPKVGPVIRGDCSQTMRPLKEGFQPRPGDEICFHGWEGKPYRSHWSRWRLHVTLVEVEELHILEDGFRIVRHDPEATFTGKWTDPIAAYLARRDFIVHTYLPDEDPDEYYPPTGIDLREVLTRLDGDLTGRKFAILRWDPELNFLELDYSHDHQEGSS